MKKKLRLKPSFHFKVDGPCEVRILMVAGKWVHLLVEAENGTDIKCGSTRRVTAVDEKKEDDEPES